MKVLLDTHCWLWWFIDPDRLNVGARRLLSEQGHEVFLSAASAWEIAIKFGLGKLTLPAPPHQYVAQRMQEQDMLELPVTVIHGVRVAGLPPHHRDPFDRMLVAQAQSDGLVLMTADAALQPYEVVIFWAGS